MLRNIYIWSLTRLKTLFQTPTAPDQPGQLHKQIPYSEQVATSHVLSSPPNANAALTKWEQGDRLALAEIQVNDVREHPDRARLALVLGSAHQQFGNNEAARAFFQSAYEWGCSKKKIAQVLLAETDKTLNRAAALSSARKEVLLKVEGVVSSPIMPKSLSQSDDVQKSVSTNITSINPTNKSDASIQDSETTICLLEHLSKISAAIELQNRKIDTLSQETRRNIKNVTDQIEAILRLQNYLDSGILIPPFHGWPVSPDFACLLVQVIATKRYDLIIEFGSGTSTVLIARVLDRLIDETQQTYQIAFEHLEKYHAETAGLLAASNTKRHRVDLVLAPLVDTQIDREHEISYMFYDCIPKLKNIAKKRSTLNSNLLVIVDGPPGATGPHARYPALPILLQAFPNARIDFVLDDTKRKDEQEIIAMWKTLLDKAARNYEISTYDFEKGATIFEIAAS